MNSFGIRMLNIYQAVSGKTREEILVEVESMAWSGFKPLLADAVVEHLRPIQKTYREVMEDESYLLGVLQDGKEAAEEVADQSLLWAKTAMGLHLP